MNKPETGKDWSDVVKGAKRELLLRAARDEFAEQGLEGATMRGIAVRAGCTTGAIYPLFDSKETIYAELLKAVAGGARCLRRRRRGRRANSGGAGRGGLSAAFLNYYLDHRFEIKSGPLCLPRPQAAGRRQAVGRGAQPGAMDGAGTHRGAVDRGPRPQAFRGPALGGAAHQPDDRGSRAADRGPAGFLQTGAPTLLAMMLAQCLPRATAPKGAKALRKSKR